MTEGQVRSTIPITFRLPAELGVSIAAVVGDFNDWHPSANGMQRLADGSFTATIEVPRGERYRYRFLTDEGRWENDWAADAYEPNPHGSDDCILDLTEGSYRLAAVIATPDGVEPRADVGREEAPVSATRRTKKAAPAARASEAPKAAPARKRTAARNPDAAPPTAEPARKRTAARNPDAAPSPTAGPAPKRTAARTADAASSPASGTAAAKPTRSGAREANAAVPSVTSPTAADSSSNGRRRPKANAPADDPTGTPAQIANDAAQAVSPADDT